MSRREFWWASFKGGEPQVVEITRDNGVPAWCYFTGTDNFLTPSEMVDLTMIAPVHPPVGDVPRRHNEICREVRDVLEQLAALDATYTHRGGAAASDPIRMCRSRLESLDDKKDDRFLRQAAHALIEALCQHEERETAESRRA